MKLYKNTNIRSHQYIIISAMKKETEVGDFDAMRGHVQTIQIHVQT